MKLGMEQTKRRAMGEGSWWLSPSWNQQHIREDQCRVDGEGRVHGPNVGGVRLVRDGQGEEQSGVASCGGYGDEVDAVEAQVVVLGDQADQHHDEGVQLCEDGPVACDGEAGEVWGDDAQGPRPGVSNIQSGDKVVSTILRR